MRKVTTDIIQQKFPSSQDKKKIKSAGLMNQTPTDKSSSYI
jgi:hypothetical protein